MGENSFRLETELDIVLYTIPVESVSSRWLDWKEFDRGPGIFHIPGDVYLGVRAQGLHDLEIRQLAAELKPVDVICQHSRDGTIYPLKVRVLDDDGEFQTYTIKDFRDQSHRGTRQLPDGVYVTDNTLVYECHVIVFGRQKMIRLYYEPSGTIWKMTAI